LERLERERSEIHMHCDATRAIHTVGHSTRTIEHLLDLLRAHDIGLVIDVRRWPASRRHPQFHREALAESLTQAGLEYVWRGDLGGFRKARPDSPNTGWKVGAFRAYADFMLTDEFQQIITEILHYADAKRAALMCAEALPWRCHRQLIADACLARGWQVRHIMDNGCHAHALPPFARIGGAKIYYDGLI
jgi:uncharacterized protein (DUF488 family)